MLDVVTIPIFEDNYTYLVIDPDSNKCIAVDPGLADPISAYIDEHNLTLDQIWITHFHKDHIGGLVELAEEHNSKVIGPKKEAEKIPQIDQTVSDLDLLDFCGHPFKILELPGHTLGHIGYWLFNDKIFFCGDTLFGLGCGKIFEGDYAMMWSSLCKIRSLPEDTHIYCGHEYTLSNAQFALSIDPDNETLQQYAKEVEIKRERDEPTVPILLKNEMYMNPFLRADLPSWREKLNLPDATAIEIFKEFREKKDKFKS